MHDLVEEVDEHVPSKPSSKEGAPPQPAPAPPPGPGIAALCVAAEDDADGVVALMADRLLRRVGFSPLVVSASSLTGELPTIVADRNAKVVVISNLPPSGFAQVRYICKRLAGRFEHLPVIIGVWGSNLDAAKARGRLPAEGSFHLVNSLEAAVREASELYQSLSLKKTEPGEDAPPDARGAAPVSTNRRTHA
jgi:hypothetical protein